MLLFAPRPYTKYIIFIMFVARHRLFVLKVLLNINQPTKQPTVLFSNDNNSTTILSVCCTVSVQRSFLLMCTLCTTVDWCSTSYAYETADEDPLLCPHGYVCHVDNDQDALDQIPNRGRCVRKPPQPPSGLCLCALLLMLMYWDAPRNKSN